MSAELFAAMAISQAAVNSVNQQSYYQAQLQQLHQYTQDAINIINSTKELDPIKEPVEYVESNPLLDSLTILLAKDQESLEQDRNKSNE